MAAFLTDTFTGTDGTDLASHTSDSGHTWTKHPTGHVTGKVMELNNNQLREVSAGGSFTTTGSLYYSSAVPSGADYEIVIDVVNIGGGLWPRFGVRARQDTAVDTGYEMHIDLNKGKIIIRKRVNGGSWTNLATATGISNGLNTTYTYKFKVSASTLEARNLTGGGDTLLASATDSAITAAGRVAVAGYNGGNAVDNRRLDNLTATVLGSGISITGNPAIGAITNIGTINPQIALSSTNALSNISPAGALNLEVDLSSSLTIGDVSSSGSIAGDVQLSGSNIISSISPDGTINTIISITGNIQIPNTMVSGVINTIIDISGNNNIPQLLVSGVLGVRVSLSGAPISSPIAVTGSIVHPSTSPTLTGSPSLSSITLVGDIQNIVDISGNVPVGAIASTSDIRLEVALTGSPSLIDVLASSNIDTIVALTGSNQLENFLLSGTIDADISLSSSKILDNIISTGNVTLPVELNANPVISGIGSSGLVGTVVTLIGDTVISPVSLAGQIRPITNISGAPPQFFLTSTGNIITKPVVITGDLVSVLQNQTGVSILQNQLGIANISGSIRKAVVIK